MSTEVSVLLYPGSAFFEVALAVEVLAPHFNVLYYSPDGAPHTASNGANMAVAGGFRELEVAPTVAVLVPGGDPGSILVPNNMARSCLVAAHERSALVAGICAGNLVLAAAGLLRGRCGTHNYTSRYASPEQVRTAAPYWEGMRYEHANVVQDGTVITAMPWAYREFAATVGRSLGVLSPERASALEAYVIHRTIGAA